MLRRSSCCRRVIAANLFAVAFLCRVGLVQAAENEQKIHAELAKPTAIEFNETSLKDVVTYFKDLKGINIELDKKRLEEANITLDVPVTAVLKGVSFRSALDLILEPMGLTYVVEREVLMITSLAGAQRSSMPRVYDVAAVLANSEASSLLKALELVLDRPANGDDGKPLSVASRLVIFRKKLILRGSQPEHDRLAELLLQIQEPSKPTAVQSAGSAQVAATGNAAAKETTAGARAAKQ